MTTKKLGEILVQANQLTPEKLKKALDAQLIFGGRLGTNLLELGLLEEAQLAEALRTQTTVNVATTDMLEGASKAALRLIPPKLAAKHVVVPLEVEGKKLKVALQDPTDLIILDELAFVSGCQVIPFVAPEVRLRTYLEQHYGIERPIRYIKLSPATSATGPTGLDDRSLAAAFTDGQLELGAPSGGAPPSPPAAGIDRPLQSADVSPEGEQVLSITELLGVEPGQELTPAALKSVGERPAEQQAQVDAALEELKKRRQEEQQEAEPAVAGLEDAARLLAEAETREDIGEALVAYARTQFPRVMTYVVQRDRALGWHAHLPDMTLEQGRLQARRVVLPLGEPSVLEGVVTSGQYYMGELPARAGDEAMAAALGRPRPQDIVLFPIKLNEKVVIALQGDGLDRPLSGFDMRSMRAVCQKAALAMEVLLLRSKIRQV